MPNQRQLDRRRSPDTLGLMTLEVYVGRKLGVASALAASGCGGSYAEACLIVSGVISAIAAYVWPGERIDRARFAEAWVRFAAPTHPEINRVSMPLLIHALYADREADALALRGSRPGMFGRDYSDRVLIGEDVDAYEAEVLATCPSLERRFVRRHSYPSVFYSHVRSQLVHEYELGHAATAYPMTTRSDPRVSYSNTLRGMWVDGVNLDASTREIHFHIEWLVGLAGAMARAVDEQAKHGNAPRPTAWWLDAG